MSVWHLSDSVSGGQKWPSETEREREREQYLWHCTTTPHPAHTRSLSLTHAQTTCTHTHTHTHTQLVLLHAAWTQDKNTLRRLEAETLQNSSACGLFRGEPPVLMCSEGTAVHLTQALCSWDRHGYHHGNKNKNSNNKRPDRQQAFSDFFPLFESPCAHEAVVPTAVSRRLLHSREKIKRRVTVERATWIMWRLPKNIPEGARDVTPLRINLIQKGQQRVLCHHAGSLAIQTFFP